MCRGFHCGWVLGSCEPSSLPTRAHQEFWFLWWDLHSIPGLGPLSSTFTLGQISVLLPGHSPAHRVGGQFCGTWGSRSGIPKPSPPHLQLFPGSWSSPHQMALPCPLSSSTSLCLSSTPSCSSRCFLSTPPLSHIFSPGGCFLHPPTIPLLVSFFPLVQTAPSPSGSQTDHGEWAPLPPGLA